MTDFSQTNDICVVGAFFLMYFPRSALQRTPKHRVEGLGL